MTDIWREDGEAALRAVTGLGERLAVTLRILVTTGRLPMLDRLRGKTDPEALLQTVPGLGPTLAKRIHHELEIESLEELDVAAHDGRLRDLA